MVELIIFLIVSYLLGSFPTSYVAGKLIKGIDLRTVGSGNLGATNVYRSLGLVPAIIVLAIDAFKGFFPVFFFHKFVPINLGNQVIVQILFGVAAIAGHIWTIFLRFKGGKGIGTALGVFLGLAPLAISLTFLIWLIIFGLFRIVSVASISSALFLPIILSIVHKRIFQDGLPIFVFSILIALLVLYTHRSNIYRLLRGDEPKMMGHQDLADHKK